MNENNFFEMVKTFFFDPAKKKKYKCTNEKGRCHFYLCFSKNDVSALPGRYESVTLIFIHLNKSKSCG